MEKLNNTQFFFKETNKTFAVGGIREREVVQIKIVRN